MWLPATPLFLKTTRVFKTVHATMHHRVFDFPTTVGIS